MFIQIVATNHQKKSKNFFSLWPFLSFFWPLGTTTLFPAHLEIWGTILSSVKRRPTIDMTVTNSGTICNNHFICFQKSIFVSKQGFSCVCFGKKNLLFQFFIFSINFHFPYKNIIYWCWSPKMTQKWRLKIKTRKLGRLVWPFFPGQNYFCQHNFFASFHFNLNKTLHSSILYI